MDKCSREDIHNQYTGKDFSDTFVRRFLSVYFETQYKRKRVVEVERVEEENIPEGPLIKLIKAELLRLENILLNQNTSKKRN